MLKEWGGIPISSDALEELEVRKKELFDLTGLKDAPPAFIE
jgi:hypothetical protein